MKKIFLLAALSIMLVSCDNGTTSGGGAFKQVALSKNLVVKDI